MIEINVVGMTLFVIYIIGVLMSASVYYVSFILMSRAKEPIYDLIIVGIVSALIGLAWPMVALIMIYNIFFGNDKLAVNE